MNIVQQGGRFRSVLLATLIAFAALGATMVGLGIVHRVAAAPVQDDGRGSWTDTFTDALGLNSTTNVVVVAAQERLELEPAVSLTQTDWSGGPGLTSTTATSTERYDVGVAVDRIVTGDLSLGFTLPTTDDLASLARDGYPDLFIGNYMTGTTGSAFADESYIYYGSEIGFTETNRSELPALGAGASAIADLNDDGLLDIVIVRDDRHGSGNSTYVYIYWGTNNGYSVDHRDEFGPSGYLGGCSVVADLDQDGYQDLVICNLADSNTWSFDIDSYIYWGSSTGYTVTRRTGVPTVGAVAGYAADFDNDGYLDLAFSNYRSDLDTSVTSTFEIDSYVYWGDGTRSGYTTTSRTELPTIGAYGHSAADLNHDGYMDLVFSNRRTGNSTPLTSTYELDSYIYWGSSTGFTDTDRFDLPTVGSYGNSLADLNDDGYPEIIFSNHDNGITHALDSYIYWNNAGTFTTTDRTELPTLGATGNCAGDLDLDGDVDIVFANRRLDDDHNIPSYIYWNDGGTYTTTRRDTLNTHGALGCSIAGGTIAAANTAYGNVYAEPITGSATITDTATTPRIYASTGVITSTGFDAGDAHVWQDVSWNASIPAGTDIALDVATSDDGTNWAAWTQVAASSSDGYNSASLNVADARFIRYRATLSASSDHRSTPVLHDVQMVGGRTAGSATSVPIEPAALDRWNTITWTAQVAAGQAITVQVLGPDDSLIPDGDLAGNSSGFSSSPLDISSLSVSTYPSITLRAGFSTDDVTSSPSLDDWSVDWFATPTALSISPADDTIAAGDMVTYTVLALDDYDKSWDVTDDSQYTITSGAGGSWADNVYSSEFAGSWTVTATYGTLVTTTQLIVNPGPLDYIVVSPSTASVDSGQLQTYTVEAFDVYGNSRGDVSASTAFAIETGADGSWDDNVYTSEKAGTWVITGTYGGQVDTATLTVANVAPTAVISGPSTGDEAETLSFDANLSSDPGNDISAYAWDLDDDGQYDDASGSSCSYAWSDNGTYTIALLVTDTGGLTDTDTAEVTVNNVAPTLTLSGDGSVDEGTIYTLTLSAVTDPGDDTVSACTVYWGDGDSEDCESAIDGTITHTYADGHASQTITVDLEDEDGTYDDVDALGVTVNNVAPALTLSGDGSVDEGSTYTLTLSTVTDPGDDTVSACRVYWGDGDDESCLGAINGTITHVYADGDDSLTISVDLTDEDGTYEGVDTLNLTVNNVAPTAADDDYSTPEDTTLTVPADGVLSNDSDVPADALMAVLDDDVGTGTLALSSDGSFAYTPTLDYNGVVTFTYHANDGAADSNTATVTITVTAENDPPEADAGGSYSTAEGGDIALVGSGSSDVDGTITTYEWDCTADGTYDVTSSNPTGDTCSYADDGTYTLRLRVTDDLSATDTDTALVTVSNVSPTLTLSGDGSVDEGTIYTLTLSAVTDPGDDTVSACRVYWGDGDDESCLGAINGTITHVYADGDDSLTISVDLTDEDGVYEGVDTLNLTVNNVAPTAADDDYSTPEDTTLTVPADGVLSNDSDVPADALTAVLDDDVGTGTLALSSDGSFAYTPTLDYNGVVTFTYHANDGAADSNTATVTITVTVENDPPEADAGGPYSTAEGGDIALDGSGSSDVDGTITTYEWDCTADGTYDVTSSNPTGDTCSYADDGTYTVRLRVTDDLDATDTDTALVTVSNVSPTLTLSGDASVDEGAVYTLTLSDVTDPGEDSIEACIVYWGDGDDDPCESAIGGSITHTYADGDDSPTISVDLTDEDGTYDAVDTLEVDVNNVPPTSDAGGPYAGAAGLPIDFSAAGSSDPGSSDTLTYEWDWDNDGTYDSTTTSASITHTWTVSQVYTVSLRVTDGDGGQDTDTALVTVTPGAADHITLSPSDYSIAADGVVTYTVEALDSFDNWVGDVTASSTFTIEVGAGGFWDGNVYHAEIEGSWVITATHQTMQASTTLHVQPYMIYLPLISRGG